MSFLPEKQDETADDSVLDTELLETDGIFDQADTLAQKFITSVQQPCRLSFRRDLVRISFFGRVEQSPLPGILRQRGRGELANDHL